MVIIDGKKEDPQELSLLHSRHIHTAYAGHNFTLCRGRLSVPSSLCTRTSLAKRGPERCTGERAGRGAFLLSPLPTTQASRARGGLRGRLNEGKVRTGCSSLVAPKTFVYGAYLEICLSGSVRYGPRAVRSPANGDPQERCVQ
jgi:hypothetical protein